MQKNSLILKPVSDVKTKVKGKSSKWEITLFEEGANFFAESKNISLNQEKKENRSIEI